MVAARGVRRVVDEVGTRGAPARSGGESGCGPRNVIVLESGDTKGNSDAVFERQCGRLHLKKSGREEGRGWNGLSGVMRGM